MSTAREEILNRIRQALATPSPPESKPDELTPIYAADDKDIAVLFAQNFVAKGGKFFFSQNYTELDAQLKAFLADRQYKDVRVWEPPLLEALAPLGINFIRDDSRLERVECSITLCEALVARTGSMLVSSRQTTGRRLTIYPPVHVVVAATSQILPDIKDGFEFLRKKYGEELPSMISLTTGPSRTADIEKTLVLGAHGPKELVLFLLDDIAT